MGKMVIEQSFAAQLNERIYPIQHAFRQLLTEWGSPATASELERLSSGGVKTCWQVFRVVGAMDVIAEAKNVPTPASLKKLLVAARNAGVSEKTVRAVEETTTAFQAFSKRAARDRAAFDSMLAGASGESEGEKIHLSQRRAAYRATSHISGVQMDVLYAAQMVMRSKSGENTDSIFFTSSLGLRRLRPDVRLRVFATRKNGSGAGSRPDEMDRWETAIDVKAARKHGMPLLPQFSKSPFPKVERVESPAGIVRFQTSDTEVGLGGAINLTMAQVYRESALQTDVDGRKLYHFTTVFGATPIALQYKELLIHRPSFPNARPELLVFENLDYDFSPEGVRRAQRFPVEERVVRVGRADQTGLAELPYYQEMLKYGAGELEWELSEFEVWRVKVPYPIMSSAVRLWFYVE